MVPGHLASHGVSSSESKLSVLLILSIKILLKRCKTYQQNLGNTYPHHI